MQRVSTSDWGGGGTLSMRIAHIRQQSTSATYAMLPLFATRFAACTGGIFGSLSWSHIPFKVK